MLQQLKGQWMRKDPALALNLTCNVFRVFLFLILVIADEFLICACPAHQEDRMSLGAIAGNSMVWEAAYKHKPSPLWEVPRVI